MKKLRAIFISLLLAGSLLLQAQQPGEELVEWHGNRKLGWADYKADPQPASGAAASTTTYLGIEYHIRNNEFSFTITCKFSKNRSWGLHKTDYILAHEQGHFDIAEVFARKLNKEMSEYQFNKKTFKADLKNIYEGIAREKEDCQNRYDKESNHSINKPVQLEWLKKIDAMLAEYADYAGYH